MENQEALRDESISKLICEVFSTSNTCHDGYFYYTIQWIEPL